MKVKVKICMIEKWGWISRHNSKTAQWEKFKKYCVDRGFTVMKEGETEMIIGAPVCGNCNNCIENVRNQTGCRTGFCTSVEKTGKYLISLDDPACNDWTLKKEENNGR